VETSLADLARRIGDDLTSLAQDHMELARTELTHGVRSGVADAGVIVLGGVVALVGLAMLCLSAVAGLRPAIPALWLRLFLMAFVYMALGGALAALAAKKLHRPKLDEARKQARRTAIALREQVTNGP
jgi:hypothetical protein